MKDEVRQVFTRRLSQCNRGQLVVIIYDLYFCFGEDVRKEAEDQNFDGYKTGIHKMQGVLHELMESLNFKYAISRELYPLYRYCSNQLSRALYEYRLDGVEAADRVMKSLYEAFKQAAAQDQSEPLMKNVQQVYAGMTYGKGDLNENYVEDSNRGFFA